MFSNAFITKFNDLGIVKVALNEKRAYFKLYAYVFVLWSIYKRLFMNLQSWF